MRFPYVLFDLDGTLADTNELILRSFEHTLEQYAPGKFTRADILPHMGEPLWDQMERFVPGKSPEMVKTYRTFNVEQHDRYVTPFPHVKDVLERLHADGVKMAIVTSKQRLTAEMGWELCQITPYLDAFITIEDTKEHKPHPAPVLAAMKLLGADPATTLMVGDSPYDIGAGKAAGVKTVGVKWSLRGEEGLRPYDPDYLVADMLELEAIIRGQDRVE
ncbi:MAG TPA: pyrophosphatase PpaX [Bacilli bacterium]|nr:pyrophosphatase PpaX [Bacilli bacterium]